MVLRRASLSDPGILFKSPPPDQTCGCIQTNVLLQRSGVKTCKVFLYSSSYSLAFPSPSCFLGATISCPFASEKNHPSFFLESKKQCLQCLWRTGQQAAAPLPPPLFCPTHSHTHRCTKLPLTPFIESWDGSCHCHQLKTSKHKQEESWAAGRGCQPGFLSHSVGGGPHFC